MFSSLFVCLFVSKTTQKVRSRFSQNSVKTGHVGHGETIGFRW